MRALFRFVLSVAELSGLSSSTAMEGKTMILKTWDKQEFKVDESVIMQSEYLTDLMQDYENDKSYWEETSILSVPMYGISPRLLEKLLSFCNYHATAKSNNTTQEVVNEWEKSFVDELKGDMPTLFCLLKVSHYLKVNHLYFLLCQTVADSLVECENTSDLQRLVTIPEVTEEIAQLFPVIVSNEDNMIP
ncbi:hypothetical protein SUGI_1145540 [Cryptomeria japonica]|uniref:SKP1-like protein 10 n=1 Tax=Cryptomeria japonica TaxID=3369 RepID=UPI0024147CDF|nr:SKP1-like protein 10 [Cryptomeria japonica]GLJ53693.1 hypothetical protein SUGI_1145540 [Cryptomeria japonica]